MPTSSEFRKKMVFSGPLVEYREFNYFPRKRYLIDREEKEAKKRLREIYKELAPLEPDEEKISTSVYRARSYLRRLIYANAWMYRKQNGRAIPPLFLTLTFEKNEQSLDYANREFSKYIQRLNYELFDKKIMELRYVAVPQFQKRGAIHYHAVLFNMPYVKKNVYAMLRDLWGHGSFVNLEKIQSAFNVHRYLSRYMEKNFLDGRLFDRKKYFASKKLNRPILIREPEVIDSLRENILKPFFTRADTFPTDYCGDIYFEHYRISENRTIFDLPIDDTVRECLNSKQ